MKPSPTDDSPDVMTLHLHRDNSAPPSTEKVAAATSPPPAEPAPAAAPCPRCGAKLTDPQGLGWCSSCGYCKSLEADANQAALAAPTTPRRPSSLGIAEFFEILGRLPSWLWVLLGGIAVVVGISVAADFTLPDDSLARALWSTIQVVVGLLGILAAQIWAFILLAPESDHLSAKDLILSARLWSLTIRRLPESQRRVWLGGWSMTAVLCAAFVINGFSYWYQYYKPKKLADRGLIAAIADAAQKANKKHKSMEEALDEFANSQDLTKKKGDEKKVAKEDKRPTQDCVIIGYTVTSDSLRKDTITSLVLATLVDGRLKYAGIVRRGIDPRQSDELLKRLAPLVQEESFIPGLKVPAIWVKPQVFCEVRQSGLDADGRLNDPNFKDLLTQ